MTQQESLDWATLTELAYLRRLQKYQKRKSDYVRHRLHWLETSCEARNRIVQSARDLRHELIESIQSRNRNKFSSLFNTFHTLKQACDEWDAQSPVPESLSNPPPDCQSDSFLDGVSPDAQEALLTFLSRISFDPLFLLDRLLGLADSAFANISRPYSQGPAGQPFFGNPFKRLSDRTEHESTKKLLDFFRSDVLSLLLNLVPTSEYAQGGPLSSAWGIICAGLLSHQKPGSDKFVITIMNAHLGQLDRTARHYLENWLLETLRDGDFILYQAEKRSFRSKGQTPIRHPNDDTKAVDEFFSTAIEKLLLILKDNKLTRVIPFRALTLGRSIVARLEPSSQQQQAAPYFLCTSWLFASYLSSLITSPEGYGLLLSHHISSTARQRILHEVAHRARHIMEGVAYSWKQTSPVMPNIVTKIESVVGLFRLDPLEANPCPDSKEPDIETTENRDDHNRHTTVCASEVMNAIRALYPDDRDDLYNDFHIPHHSALDSSVSSVSGLSLFQALSPLEPTSPRNGYCDVVSEVGTPTGFPLPGPTSKEHLPDRATPAGDVFVHRLREACIELAVSAGCNSDAGSCDLFSEQWTSLETYFDGGTAIWIESARSIINCSPDSTSPLRNVHAAQLIGLQTFDFINTGIHTLLDGYFSVTISNRGPLPQDAISLHTSLVAQFEGARASCYHQGDFAKAHLFFRLAKATTSLSPELTSQILQAAAKDIQQSIDVCRLRIQKEEARVEKLHQKTDFLQTEMQSISYMNDRLREKMWYTADIQRAGHYEDLRKVVTALRIMATSTTTRPKTEKKKPLLRHRSASKSLNHSMQLKAEAATLELLSVPVENGGTNKLSDVQTEMTLRWMEARGVERVCRAEERIHRFCSELTRCLDHFVGQSVVENPILWSSQLFQNQRSLSGHTNDRVCTPSFDRSALEQLRAMYDNKTSGAYDVHTSPQWSRVSTPSRSTIQPSFAARSMSPKSVTHDYFGCRSPTLTHKSSGMWSTFSAGPQSPSSATSFPSRALSPMSTGRSLSRHSCLRQNQASFLEELKQNLTSLLLSDFHDIFRSGSETDKAMRKILKLRLPARNELSEAMEYKHDSSRSSFDFDQVFRMLLRRFELQASPYAKLDILLELQSMLKAHRADCELENRHDTPQSNSGLFTQRRLSLRIDTWTAPRTSLGHDSTILSFRQIFKDPQLRPKTLFRDLQYIATLVPLNILDSTPRGRAFWNATIAALDLKEETCQSMIETADQIIHHHTSNRGHSHITSAAQAKRDAAAFSPPTPQPNDPSIADLSMSDAATLLQITAKEGIPAAQRELATLYLTHPELLGICLSPFSKVKDVFKDVEKDREVLSERYDPVAMAVAQHWMELSARGGDGPAARYLRAKDEFDRIP